jgi:hypothetical protein
MDKKSLNWKLGLLAIAYCVMGYTAAREIREGSYEAREGLSPRYGSRVHYVGADGYLDWNGEGNLYFGIRSDPTSLHTRFVSNSNSVYYYVYLRIGHWSDLSRLEWIRQKEVK